uniref:J domain-containing protein n=1 Tax=Panagrolaimus superbus TaxID=310955 RepID=A0A914Z5V7_9BILA
MWYKWINIILQLLRKGKKNIVKTLFGTTDLYFILQITQEDRENLTDAKLKKAYYKQSMLWHPDRFSNDEDDKKVTATRKFQVVSKAYNILNDPAKKELYDSTGLLDDDSFDCFSENTDWNMVWRAMFKPITKKDIENFFKKYRGSEDETKDIIKYYNKYKGDLNKILECVIGGDDEERIRYLINDLIATAKVEAFDKFVKEPEAARIKRQKKREKEAKAVEKETKKMQKKTFAERAKRREAEGAALFAHLEKKYGGGSKRSAIEDSNPKPRKARK